MLRSSILFSMVLALSIGCDSRTDTNELTDSTMPMTAPVDEPDEGPTASVRIEPTAGNTASGVLLLTQTDDGVEITGRLGGLPPGESLGFHVHEMADCSAPDASSAGEHFNPTNEPHGDPDDDRSHLGDMPNVEADDDGVADVDVTVDGVTLTDGPYSLDDRAVVVHAQPDDFETQPAGGSGNRIGCGEIVLAMAGTSGVVGPASDPVTRP